MIEFIVLCIVLLIGGWAWKNIIYPMWRSAVTSHQLSRGIITLQPCTVDGDQENTNGVIRKLSPSEMQAYGDRVKMRNPFLAVFKYGTDTGLRIRESAVTAYGPGSGSIPPFAYEAFDIKIPGKYFDTSYPCNESSTPREFAHLILRRDDRWQFKSSTSAL